MDNEIRETKTIELGTFSFLQLGWWVLHIIAIVLVFYLGHLFGNVIFR
ncbi:MAG: hypothetical protein ACM3PP_09475 [Candidatus Saccharibacteria bacterium]